ncbi:hypothetical protein CK820_G0001503 [Pan troglodytes]|uniref:Uncharacterized protein n=1 Tax=Pan troglodytes TaxID=9598 RepID=A0A2J8PR06_PANTR|nr:hypothetical protein CK820_G0001503 [Pan troglodytes]
MNPVPQMEMQKSPISCVTQAGSCRPELFLFGHLGSSAVVAVLKGLLYSLGLYELGLDWNCNRKSSRQVPKTYIHNRDS